VLSDWHAPPIALSALYPRHRHLSAKTRLLVEFLVDQFGDRPYWDLLD
jgi:DNA-binding transcriptional LysR family regulator